MYLTIENASDSVQRAKVTINPAGIRFTVEDGSYLQAKSFLRSEVFQTYQCRDADTNIQFQVNMTVLLDCLSMFGSSTNTALQIRFPASSDKLILMYCCPSHLLLSAELLFQVGRGRCAD